jgi:hypothetical protein
MRLTGKDLRNMQLEKVLLGKDPRDASSGC